MKIISKFNVQLIRKKTKLTFIKSLFEIQENEGKKRKKTHEQFYLNNLLLLNFKQIKTQYFLVQAISLVVEKFFSFLCVSFLLLFSFFYFFQI